MVADSLLPVWSIRPNWKDGILERLGWLTDVLPSTYGVEQRRALRVSPRRSFEINFNFVNEERSYFDLWLHRLGSQELMLPLFHDKGRLSAAIVGGATAIPFDTTNREFAVGELAIITGDDPFIYSKVTILAMTDAGITVGPGEVAQAWAKGSAIYPLRRARMSQESAASALTSRVGQATLEFQLNQGNEIADEGVWGTLYNTYPVLLDKPNWREVRDLSFIRNSLLLDNEHGLTHLGDDAGRAFTVDVHSRLIRGRAEHKAFRQFLYRLRGQQGAIWVPTFNRDFTLSQPSLFTDSKLVVKTIGYAYTGGAVSGRRHVLLSNGAMKEITAVGTAPSPTEERLNTSTTIGGIGLLAGSYGSFMDTCRLAQDDIEITHHTDTDGLAECNLAFRSFRDERVPPAITRIIIPDTDPVQATCGTPAVEEADCAIFDTGFYSQLIFDWDLGSAVSVNQPYRNVTYFRGGINILYHDTSDGLGTQRLGTGGTKLGITDTIPVGFGGRVTDPWAGGPPDHIEMLVQFNVGSFGAGTKLGRVSFKLPNENPIVLTCTFGTAGVPTTTITLSNLWPRDYEFSVP